VTHRHHLFKSWLTSLRYPIDPCTNIHPAWKIEHCRMHSEHVEQMEIDNRISDKERVNPIFIGLYWDTIIYIWITIYITIWVNLNLISSMQKIKVALWNVCISYQGNLLWKNMFQLCKQNKHHMSKVSSSKKNMTFWHGSQWQLYFVYEDGLIVAASLR